MIVAAAAADDGGSARASEHCAGSGDKRGVSMDIVPVDEAFAELIDPSWIEELDATPFLSRCRRGEAGLEELKTFVLQHHFYSRHFTRYLCALLANLTDEGHRLELAFNLFEELGLGEFGQVPHSQIYREMMRALGVDAHGQGVLASTGQLVDCMFQSCLDANPLNGLGALCLGAEAIVPHVYSQIVRGFLGAGVPREQLDFFLIHIEADDGHALTMKKIIERELGADPGKARVLRASARRAIRARVAFFQGLSLAPLATLPRRKAVNDAVRV
jgi:pyrroloquinoline quinone (PQQ) biosynthesis protein C